MSELLVVRFLLAVLAAWLVTQLLANEDGPSDAIVKLRGWLGHSLLGSLLDCFNCLSFWIAAPLAVFVSRDPLTWLISWLVSGGACLLQRLGEQPIVIESVPNISKGDHHVLR
jgi:hypothetical protein